MGLLEIHDGGCLRLFGPVEIWQRQRIAFGSERVFRSPTISQEPLVGEHGLVLAGGLRAIHRTICAAQDGGDVEWFASRVG